MMARKGRARLRRLADVVAKAYPDLQDPLGAIVAGRVLVDGWSVKNPASLVRPNCAVAIRRDAPLRGEAKLAAALDRFGIAVAGRVALDLGAAAGGFTRVLLRNGALKVYAVDAGFGQLLGSLRLDPRVVNLERTNLAALGREHVPDEVEVVTVDLSYLALGEAVRQLSERIALADRAELLALVKPQFELGHPRLPVASHELDAAIEAATTGIERAGWSALGTIESPVRGARGAIEFLVHAGRR